MVTAPAIVKMRCIERGPWAVSTLRTAVMGCTFGNAGPDRIHASYETMQVLVGKISSDVSFPVSEQLQIMGMNVRIDPMIEFGKLHIISSAALDRPQFHCEITFEDAQ